MGEILLPILLHAGAAGFARSASLKSTTVYRATETTRAVVWLDENLRRWETQYQVTDTAHMTCAKSCTNGRGWDKDISNLRATAHQHLHSIKTTWRMLPRDGTATFPTDILFTLHGARCKALALMHQGNHMHRIARGDLDTPRTSVGDVLFLIPFRSLFHRHRRILRKRGRVGLETIGEGSDVQLSFLIRECVPERKEK